MNFPNTLSILWIILTPIFVFSFLSGSAGWIFFSLIVFTAAALTDWYDGWYARKYGFKTRWGQFLDPLADKILTSGAFISFYVLNTRDPRYFGTVEIIPLSLLIAVIIFRDMILTAVRSFQELKGKEFRTSMISKTKTFVQMTYIFLVLVTMTISYINPGSVTAKSSESFLFSSFNYYLLLAVSFLTLASAAAYIFESKTGINSELA